MADLFLVKIIDFLAALWKEALRLFLQHTGTLWKNYCGDAVIDCHVYEKRGTIDTFTKEH